jgi:hypothetical protein
MERRGFLFCDWPFSEGGANVMGYLLIWLLCGIISAIVASNKGRSGFGWFIIGLLLGPLGLILSLAVSKKQKALEAKAVETGSMKKCPSCAEFIKQEAIKCRYCGESLQHEGMIELDEKARCPNCGSLNIQKAKSPNGNTIYRCLECRTSLGQACNVR